MKSKSCKYATKGEVKKEVSKSFKKFKKWDIKQDKTIIKKAGRKK